MQNSVILSGANKSTLLVDTAATGKAHYQGEPIIDDRYCNLSRRIFPRTWVRCIFWLSGSFELCLVVTLPYLFIARYWKEI